MSGPPSWGPAAEAGLEEVIGPLVEQGYRLALVMLRDPAEAEDAIQEATVKAWRGLPELRDPAAARSWFFAIVANQCRTVMRGRWWRHLRGGSGRAAEPESDPFEAADRAMDLDHAMSRLRAEDRALLYLHFFHDRPLDEAAQMLGISAGAARSRLYRSAHRLRPDLVLEEQP